MTTPEIEIGRTDSSKKRFFRMPEGIQDFNDEQIDAFAEYLYDQIMQGSDQVLGEDPTAYAKDDGGEK